jgi:ligand-binding sensor domain-containing protein/anti-sigma regulatory factor (Ser/Thr protein kinase)
MRSLSIICIVICVTLSSRAQNINEKDFLHFTTKEGLSDNYVTGVQQDETGYTWISTHWGLNRFDGSNFKQFLHSNDPASLVDNNIIAMQLFEGNQLALAMSGGAEVLSTQTLHGKNLQIPADEELKYWSNSTRSILRDNDGNFAVSNKTGYYIFSAGGKLQKRFDYYTAKDIGNNWMMFGQRLHKLPDGNTLQQNQIGTLVYNRVTKKFSKLSECYPSLSSLDSQQERTHDLILVISSSKILVFDHEKNVFSFFDLRLGYVKSVAASFNLNKELGWQSNPALIENNVWAVNSMTKGFYVLEIDTVACTVSCSSKKYFADQFCTTILSDSHRRLWVGTTNGVFVENIHPKLIQSFAVGKPDSGDLSITSLCVAPDKIFAGTDQEKILVIDKKMHTLMREIQLPWESELPEDIRYIQRISPNILWIATAGVFWLNTENLSYGRVLPSESRGRRMVYNFFYTDRHHNVWIPTEETNTVLHYNQERKALDSVTQMKDKNFKVNSVNVVAEDAKGNMWFSGDAISKWDPQAQRMERLIDWLPGQRNKKKGYIVMSDSRGSIWTKVVDDGFAEINDDRHPVFLRPENLVPDNNVICYPSLLNDRIFLATKNGIGFLDLNSRKGYVFTNADGMPQTAITSFFFANDPVDKSTWFACGHEICRLPFEAALQSSAAPFLQITDLTVLNDSLINYPPPIVKLHHNQNNIKISFGAINYDDPASMRFAYRIKNKKDSSWIDAGTQSNILLTNISSGDYKFQVKVYAYDNKWPERIKDLEIVILPPFWKSWWFITMLALLVAASAYALHKRRLNQVREKAAVDKQLMELEMKALHAQMNPHFIFNCLNSIKEMILHDEKQNASRYLSKFAQIIRVTLEESRQPFITVAQCVDHLKQYLEMEKVRFDSFAYDIHVEPGLVANEIQIAPMLVQPLVENAIWHGLQKQHGEKKVDIRFFRQEAQLVCEIEDNGIGIRDSLEKGLTSRRTHRSVGIRNIEERLDVLNEKYNMNCGLTITDKSELGSETTGTLATLRLNI